ncbi:UvrB/UvrC motif-containing protein, partial [Patescibacteria group bacterium]|nr:UvrB/UvrC motif-containing protein [Patescibacteria group bacterium]
QITDLQTIEVFSELEALILEAELIKKFKPRYNINLKDDKSYLYVVIRKELGFSKILTARKNDLLKTDIVFGPFPNGQAAKSVVRAIRRLFPFRDCSQAKFAKYQKLGSPCLYGHIHLCPAPCTDSISQQDYQQNIAHISRFLRGKQKQLLHDWQSQMTKHAANMEYEQAEELRQLLNRFEYIQQQFRAPQEFMENPYLVDDVYETALKELVEALPILTKVPERIECYDVANIAGKDAAVSMVVALNGRLEKREYKKFRIKLKNTPDDLAMMREALTRRFWHETRADRVSWGLPDLVVVDGGKGQVGIAIDVLTELELTVPVIGLTKKEEVIVYRQPDKQSNNLAFAELRLDRTSEALKLLQRLRDESHRFARVYHHLLRIRNSLL